GPGPEPRGRRSEPGRRHGHELREPGALDRVLAQAWQGSGATGLPCAARAGRGDRAPQARGHGHEHRHDVRGPGRVRAVVEGGNVMAEAIKAAGRVLFTTGSSTEETPG